MECIGLDSATDTGLGKRKEFRDQCVRVSRDGQGAFECLPTPLSYNAHMPGSSVPCRMNILRIFSAQPASCSETCGGNSVHSLAKSSGVSGLPSNFVLQSQSSWSCLGKLDFGLHPEPVQYIPYFTPHFTGLHFNIIISTPVQHRIFLKNFVTAAIVNKYLDFTELAGSLLCPRIFQITSCSETVEFFHTLIFVGDKL